MKVGYEDRLRRPPVLVYLNGILQRDVWSADDEKKEVVRLVRDEQGRFVRDGDHVRRETLRGKVRIVNG